MNAKQNVQRMNVPRMFSFALLLVVIGVVGVLFYRVMAGFLLPLFLAALLVVIFKPLYEWILNRCKGRVSLAALLTTLTIFVVVLAPLTWALSVGVTEGLDLLSTDPRAQQQKLAGMRKKLGLELPYKVELEEMQSLLNRAVPDENEPFAAQNWQARVRWLTDLITNANAMQDELQLVRQNDQGDAATAQRAEQAVAELTKMVESLQTALAAARELSQAAALDQAAREEYGKELSVAQIKYKEFRNQLLGGILRALLVGLVNPAEATLRQWQSQAFTYAGTRMVSLTGETTAFVARSLIDVAIMMVAVFYFLVDGPKMIKAVMRLSPLNDEHEAQLIHQFDSVSRAVVLATLLSAFAQGCLAGVGYYFAGLNSLFLLTLLTMLLALVPFIGAAAVWIPASIYLAFVANRVPAGIGLAVYGLVVVSVADNVIKPWVLHGQSKLHPLLALLSVLGGVQTLGPVGILVGPMVVSFLQALLNILQQELSQMDSR